MTTYHLDHSDLNLDHHLYSDTARSRHALAKQDYIENRAARLAAEDAERRRREVVALQSFVQTITRNIQDAIADTWCDFWQKKPADIL